MVHFSGWVGKRVWEELPLTLLGRPMTIRMEAKKVVVVGGGGVGGISLWSAGRVIGAER
jgi:hypothetical protein